MAADVVESSSGCPFCEIAQGRDSGTQIVWEAEDWIAFFPLKPATVGHTLVIPRLHVRNFMEVQPPLDTILMDASIKVARAVQVALKPEGMNLITSAGEAAEQTVFHLHLHVLPRWRSDGFGHIWPDDTEADPAKLTLAAKEIKRTLRG